MIRMCDLLIVVFINIPLFFYLVTPVYFILFCISMENKLLFSFTLLVD